MSSDSAARLIESPNIGFARLKTLTWGFVEETATVHAMFIKSRPVRRAAVGVRFLPGRLTFRIRLPRRRPSESAAGAEEPRMRSPSRVCQAAVQTCVEA
ncbi:hypothetical protein GCM10023147_43510 [Tsukamurella soli]|uniref:Uncharacterized protein n=1 Tax=Tsukamurella soli TaxID=644556 RepID=A0ABP8K9W1_9ACTN